MNDIKTFYDIVSQDKILSQKLKKQIIILNAEDTFELENFIKIQIIPMAKEKGFEFTVKDLLDYENKLRCKLSDEDLELVSGGISLTDNWKLKFLSLGMTGLFLTSSIRTSAIISKSTMENSNNEVIQIFQDEKKNIDWSYLSKLNLNLGREAIDSGLIKDLRFENGYINSVSEEKVSENEFKRKFSRDDGEGSAYVIKYLFPSADGVLTSNTQSNEAFSFCNPSVNLMAQVFSLTYSIRNELDNVEEEKNKFVSSASESLQSTGKQTKKVFQRKLRKFLDSIEVMIKDQEEKDKVFPEYTTEKILLAYFVDHFNNEDDIKNFYSEILKSMESLSNVESNEEEKEKIKKEFEEQYSKAELLEGFKTCFDNEESMPKVSKIFLIKPEEEKYQFGGTNKNPDEFSDCVEISTRNLFNLLSYDNKAQRFLYQQEMNAEDSAYIENLKSAIETRGRIDLKSKKEIFRLFYIMQTPSNSTNSDMFFKTAWNSVLFGINEENDEGLYPLGYVRSDNELFSGFLNSLKIYWNLVKLARDDCNEELNEIKSDISEIEQEMKKSFDQMDDIKNKLEVVFAKIFNLINPNYKIEVSIKNLSFDELRGKHNENEFFGDVDINVFSSDKKFKLFKCSLRNHNGHADTKFKLSDRSEINIENLLGRNVNQETETSRKFYNINKMFDLYKKGIENGNSIESRNLIYELDKSPNMFNDAENVSIKRVEKGEAKEISNLSEEVSKMATDRNALEKFKKILKTLVNGTIVSDLSLFDDPDDFFIRANGKTLMSEAIEKLSYEQFSEFVDKYKSDFENKVNSTIAINNNFGLTMFDYAIKEKDWEKAKKIASLAQHIDTYSKVDGSNNCFDVLVKEEHIDILKDNKEKFDINCYASLLKYGSEKLKNELDPNWRIKDNIYKGNDFNFKDIENLSSDEIFMLFDGKSIMYYAIEKFSDEDFSLLLNKLDPNILQNRLVSSEFLQDMVYRDATVFDYAVRSRDFPKVEEILKHIEKVKISNVAEFDQENLTWWCSSLGLLLREGHLDLVKKYKEKFDFYNNPVFINFAEGQEFTGEEYVKKIIRNDDLIKSLFGETH